MLQVHCRMRGGVSPDEQKAHLPEPSTVNVRPLDSCEDAILYDGTAKSDTVVLSEEYRSDCS
jgi:hypothetical protein